MSNFFRKIPAIKRLLGVFGLMSFLLISGCDLLLPAPPLPPTATTTQTLTPTPTIDWFPATLTPTLIPLPSQTPQPTLADQREGVTELLVDDNFTTETLWMTQQNASGNVAYGLQNLTLAVARQNASLSSLSQHSLPTNFYLEVSIQTLLCQPADQVGIDFLRQSESDFYRLLLNCAGQYRLELVQGGKNIVLHDWDAATQMQLATQATNRLGLWSYQGQFLFFINDVLQFTERISQDRSGGLAVFARTISGSAMTIRFSDLQIYRVESD